jgi:hypothetical protein
MCHRATPGRSSGQPRQRHTKSPIHGFRLRRSNREIRAQDCLLVHIEGEAVATRPRPDGIGGGFAETHHPWRRSPNPARQPLPRAARPTCAKLKQARFWHLLRHGDEGRVSPIARDQTTSFPYPVMQIAAPGPNWRIASPPHPQDKDKHHPHGFPFAARCACRAVCGGGHSRRQRIRRPCNRMRCVGYGGIRQLHGCRGVAGP